MKRKLCLVTLAAAAVALVGAGMPKISEAKAYAGDASSSVSFPEGYGSTRRFVFYFNNINDNYWSLVQDVTVTIAGAQYSLTQDTSGEKDCNGFYHCDIPVSTSGNVTAISFQRYNGDKGNWISVSQGFEVALSDSWKILVMNIFNGVYSFEWNTFTNGTLSGVVNNNINGLAKLIEGYYTCANSDINGYKAIDEIQDNYIDLLTTENLATLEATSITDIGYSTTVTASAKIAQMHAMNGTSSAGSVIATSSIGNNAYVFVIAISSAAVFVSATAIIAGANRKKRKEQK